MLKIKYVKSAIQDIIAFSETLNHSDFKNLFPLSAGFIGIYPQDDKIACQCYGKSITLGMNSDTEKDSMLATKQYRLFQKKYIRTKDGQIIIFPETTIHATFKQFQPISAGFITISSAEEYKLRYTCHGRSESLDLDSRPEEDSKLAQLQFT